MQQFRRVLAAVCGVAMAATGAVAAAGVATAAEPGTIPLTVTNDAGRGPVYLYVLGEDLGTGEMGWADESGAFHPWPDAGVIPEDVPDVSIAGPEAGQNLTIRLPQLSGRIYFSYGEPLTFQIVNDGRLVQPAVQNPDDPNRDVMFSWTEFTLNDAGLWINSTQVDFFSAPYQVGVERADGSVLSTGMLVPDGFAGFFDELEQVPGWSGLIQRGPDGEVLRALNPSHALGIGELDENALGDYVDRVWSQYGDQDLTVTPFGYQPDVTFTGRVDGDVMRFRDGTGEEVATFPKPSTDSILGCHQDLHAPNDQVVGPIARTLCAGFNRTTLLTNPRQPDAHAADFYQDEVTNHYGRLVHASMANGRAYAFAFDDVGAHESLVHDGDPQAAFISLDPFTGAASPIGGEGEGGE
ncbi:MAG: glycoside hydrolase family 64 protein [Cellulomonadaceae bacterium]